MNTTKEIELNEQHEFIKNRARSRRDRNRKFKAKEVSRKGYNIPSSRKNKLTQEIY